MIHNTTLKLKSSQYVKLAAAFFFLSIALCLFVWSLYNYQAPPVVYGPRVMYSVVVLSITLALLGRFLLLRIIKRESGVTRVLYHRLPRSWQTLFLLDITAPIYLAAGVLVGVPAAVLTALLTQTALQIFTIRNQFVSLMEASYRIVSTALVVLVADGVFIWIAGTQQYQAATAYGPRPESSELVGCIISAVVMMFLLMLINLPTLISFRGDEAEQLPGSDSLPTTIISRWKAYLRSPVFLFQAMVLSVGPLLPVVDIFDNVMAEVAWLFFLVPLFAIYYLALASTRLSIRTDTLQKTLTDLSSARRRQDELRDYATLITRVQEEERRRLARELHDDTAQALIALALGLDGLGRAIGKLDLPEKDREWLVSLQNLADQTLEGVRRACRDLRPSVLDDLGLRAALEWLSDSSSARGIPCTFACLGTSFPLAPENEIAIYRISQEALSNIWRHSGATQASVDIEYLPERLRLSIRDDGRGFIFQDMLDTAHNPHGSLGLVGMRERAALIGAQLNIQSLPGSGCHIELTLPIVSAQSSEQAAGI